jgi:hypothetical protein
MKPAEIPLEVHFDETFSAVNDVLEESGILAIRQTRVADVLIQYHASKCYSVVGLKPNQPAMPANLRQQISIKSVLSSRKLKRDVIIAGVDRFFQPADFALLGAKFGEEFDRFLLLNDVALEACNDCNCNFTFVGTIPQAHLLRPGTLLTCSYWR